MKLTSILITLLIFGLIDLYVYKGITGIFQNLPKWYHITLSVGYWVISIAVLLLLIFGISNRNSFDSMNTLTLIIGVFITLLLPKVVFLLFHAIDDLYNLSVFAFSKINAETDYSRRNFISQLGLMASSLMFGSMVYGVVWGKFNFRVVRTDITSARIPSGFDGLKIVQISDTHLGSFGDNIEPVRKAVQMINELAPDYVFFTGDLVNNHADEAKPWINLFAEIEAKEGKYSVFGNHDYGDYGNYTSEERRESVESLKEIHRQMGFRLLEDENVLVTRDGDQMRIIGVHNWGRGFHQIGNLERALSGTDPDEFQILLSHDPTHFEEQVKHKTKIDLTLSGHTHGMQMGIEIPSLNIKWSPVSMRYRRWAGLYQDDEQKIYINRGFGVLAFPGRVGMPPEISLLTLRSIA